MFDAQLLFGKTGDTVVFSPWFPRGGDNLTATLEVIDIQGVTSLKVEVFTKNSEETGPGENSIAMKLIDADGVGRSSETWVSTTSAGLEELVRYKFTVVGSSSQWVLFRMLSPVWFDDVKGA